MPDPDAPDDPDALDAPEAREARELLQDLLAVVPVVGATLEEHGVAEPDPELPVLWMASVGRAVCEVYPDLSGAERDAAFAVVERHLTGGSETHATAVATGLLEHVASAVSGGRLDGTELASHLGPRSRAYLDAWDRFTLGRSSLEPPDPVRPTDAAPPRGARRGLRRRRRP